MSATLPPLPALAVGTVRHKRRRPLDNAFTHRHYQWLVDLDALPPLGLLAPLARFDARDHLDRGRSGGIAGDLRALLKQSDRPALPNDRLLMLTHARVLGHVFNSLTVYWVLTSNGECRTAVLEVHNTYGSRQAYVLDLDGRGRARTAKAMYVSPFNGVEGEYAIRLQLSSDAVSVVVGLDVNSERVLTASTRARLRPATRPEVLRAALRYLPMPWREALLIRMHGIGLWRRGLPLQARPPRHSGCPVHVQAAERA